ncbi:hypothetical protein ABMA27_008525 [Loxostege sticticalis]|uniref:CRAL-TRIO domain-containing protein n=1 Tax=Loxostege sticticalis TaxID=481309 RepID=A0ABR3HBN5_LOXSC
MQALTDKPLLKHNSDTLEVVRREYDLHKPGRIEESVDRLDEWVKAQPHFNKKDYSREYLENFIIHAKGSVERAKGYIEKLCAYKTYGPQHFVYSTKPIDMNLENIHFFPLPRLTKEYHRVYFLRNSTQKDYTPEIMLEYSLKHNYALGAKVILDYRKTDLSYFVTAIKYAEYRNALMPFWKGYATSFKSIHIITTSKIVDLLVAACSQFINPKTFGRIYVHANIEELYDHIDKDLMPSDYGGKEKSTEELNDAWNVELSTDEYMEYIKDMFQATIDPLLKPMDKFDDLFTGMQGTFRSLAID